MNSTTIQPSPPARLLDVPIEPMSLRWGVVLTCVFFGTIVSMVVIVVALALPRPFPWPMNPMLPGMAFGLVIAMLVLWRYFRVRRRVFDRVSESLRMDPSWSMDELFKRFLVPGAIDVAAQLQGIVMALVADGRVNKTVRLCSPEFAAPVQPMTEPFEPLPLDESLPVVHALSRGSDKPDRRMNSALPPPGSELTTQEDAAMWLKIRRNIALGGGKYLLGIFIFMWIIQAYNYVATWHLTPFFVFWTLVLAANILGFGGRGACVARKQWLIVPAGLVSRRAAGFLRSGWRVHLFERRLSALGVYHQTKNLWFVCIADATQHQTAMVTSTECHALLRAWLSPLEPPDPDRLSDLA